MSDICYGDKYYGALIFVTRVADKYHYFRILTPTADEVHGDGFGTRNYGTPFEFVTYYTNNHLVLRYLSTLLDLD